MSTPEAPRDWWVEYQTAAQRLDLVRRRVATVTAGADADGPPVSGPEASPPAPPAPRADRTERRRRRLRWWLLAALPPVVAAGAVAWWLLVGR